MSRSSGARASNASGIIVSAIIAGGLGEKQGTEVLEENIRGLLKWGRETGKVTPIVNGGNCMGIYSAFSASVVKPIKSENRIVTGTRTPRSEL